jgi:hypothetical protein
MQWTHVVACSNHSAWFTASSNVKISRVAWSVVEITLADELAVLAWSKIAVFPAPDLHVLCWVGGIRDRLVIAVEVIHQRLASWISARELLAWHLSL